MTYSIIGILASIILLISNRDILWKEKDRTLTRQSYRYFLLGVLAYYVTDLLWGILEAAGPSVKTRRAGDSSSDTGKSDQMSC